MSRVMLFLAAIAGLVLAEAPWRDAAATTPLVVQNRDEPGRVPYQEAQIGTCANPLTSIPACTVLFAKVPAGTHRVIDHVSCRFVMQSTSTLDSARLYAQGSQSVAEYLPLNATTYLVGGAKATVVNIPTEVFYAPGDRPEISTLATGPALSDVRCMLTGHNVVSP